jgi:predicted permease
MKFFRLFRRARRDPEQARVNTLREFGNVGLIKDATREMWGGATLERLGQDLRFGARILRKNKGFSLIAVLSLALGIGANTAIFSLIDAVLLRMLPVDKPEELVFIQNVGPRRPDGGAPPYPCFERFRDHHRYFAGLAAFQTPTLRLRVDDQVEEVQGQRVSGNYFSLLGVKVLLGRALSPSDDAVPGHGGPDGLVAVISHNYWTRRFGQSPAVIGKVIYTGNQSVTIIGVTPREFYGLVPGRESDITLPITSAGDALSEKTSWWFQAVGRLKPGVSVEQGQAELDTIFQSYLNETDLSAESRREVFNRIELRSASKGLNSLRRQFSQPLRALMAIVTLVLLIACANVANLLLARASARRKEFALRLALGASRLRLLRQMLTESLLLVTLGGMVGLLFARWAGTFLVSFFATGRERLFVELPLDYRVLLFTAGVALLTVVFFGLAPALQATRIEPNATLKESAGLGAGARGRLGKLLVVAQVALSFLLLVGAGLFLRTLFNLKSIDAGFRSDGVLTMRVHAPETMAQGAHRANLWNDVLARVERIPGVRAASLSMLSPLDGNDRTSNIEVPGFAPSAERDKEIRFNQVSPNYFQTFGITLPQGRSFTDSENTARVALLNEASARFYFGGRSPLGAQIRYGFDPQRDQEPPPYEVVGVVQDTRSLNLRETDTRLFYLPVAPGFDRAQQLTLAVRSDRPPTELTKAIINELRSINTNLLFTNLATLNDRVDQSLLQERLVAMLSLFFGLLALLLACIGLYGVMSYDVACRTNEIGIRMALGADAQRVVRLVLRESAMWVALGLTIGLLAALATTRWLKSLLFGLQPYDPLTIGLAFLLLLALAALAAYLPARRAARVDPLIALRRE